MAVRAGSTRRRADRILVEKLRRFARNEAFDEQPVPELDSEAIDFRAASELFTRVRALKRQDLRALRITATRRGREAPAEKQIAPWNVKQVYGGLVRL
jgi:predicted HTH transcriptional regulator